MHSMLVRILVSTVGKRENKNKAYVEMTPNESKQQFTMSGSFLGPFVLFSVNNILNWK